MSINPQLDKWTSGAAYDAWMGRWSRLLADEFLRWLNLPERLQWLDVCCGSGVLSEAVVERCAPAGITGIDASPGQLAFAREHRSHSNVAYEVGDAMALRFAGQQFDVTVCGLGLNFLPGPEQAVQEMRRVTRAGGAVAAYVWDYAEGARFLREFWNVAATLDTDAGAFDQARRFPMCTEIGMRQLFEAAGLQAPCSVAIEMTMRFENFADYWEPFSSGQGSAPNYLASRDQRIRDAIREQLRQTLPFSQDGSVSLPARAWAVRGQCP